MTISKKITRSGRVVVTMDGYSMHYKAFVRGATVCRVSLPNQAYADRFVNDMQTTYGRIERDVLLDMYPGIRIYELRRIQ